MYCVANRSLQLIQTSSKLYQNSELIKSGKKDATLTWETLQVLQDLLSMESWTTAKKSFKLVWQCNQFLTKNHLPWVSYQSCLSANDKGVNEMLLGAVCRSPGIYIVTDENPGKPQLGDHLIKTVWPSLPQMGSLTSRWCR